GGLYLLKFALSGWPKRSTGPGMATTRKRPSASVCCIGNQADELNSGYSFTDGLPCGTPIRAQPGTGLPVPLSMIRPVTTTPFRTRRSIVSGSYAGVSPAVAWAGMYPLTVSAATSAMYDFALRAP